MGKLPRTFILLFLITGLIFFKVNSFLKPTDILYEGKITDLDVEDTVEVYFDDYGVPSVFASNDSDMFKVAGYIGARDRLFQMSFMKYAYKGHLSLVLNDSLIAEDTFLRTLGFEKIAKKTLAKVPPSTLQHLQDTCFGINTYIQTLAPSEFPLEFKLKRSVLKWNYSNQLSVCGIFFEKGKKFIDTWAWEGMKAKVESFTKCIKIK